METRDTKKEKRRETEAAVLEKVAQVISSVHDAKHVDGVICALHSLAVLLFPLDSRAISGTVDEKYKDQVLSAKAPSEQERSDWWCVFYTGLAFPTLGRVLLNDVASTWLACFPLSAMKKVYDVFFVNGQTMEVVQTVVPFLQKNSAGSFDANAVCSNAGRVLTLCLLENNGLLLMAREFGASPKSKDIGMEQLQLAISGVAQLVTSIPDRAHLGALKALSSHLFFKRITAQLLSGAEEFGTNVCSEVALSDKNDLDGTLLFIGEVFARICRRGSADILLSEVMPQILGHVRSVLSSDSDLTTSEVFERKPGSQFWLKIMKATRDPFVIERISEQLLRQLAATCVSDVEAYWTLWVLYKRIFEHQASIRTMFVEKFLLWKVFPVCCLRWILQFAIHEFPPGAAVPTKAHNIRGLLDTVQHLAAVWCKREFVQSASLEQQAYVTAALGLSLEKMSKEDLDSTKDVMHSILQGVSCRLESPFHLVRRTASSIALVFSRVIDPNSPLYLDDSYREEAIDWEFGLANPEKGTLTTIKSMDNNINQIEASNTLLPEKKFDNRAGSGMGNNSKARKTKLSEFKLLDPDEVIDPAMLNNEFVSGEEEDDGSENSEISSDSSLQPYDLSDDDVDLEKKLSQLVDVVGAIRKSEDADGVERALDVAEKLVRASPDELKYIAGDLVRALVQVRCSDSAMEGEEESAEEKRQKALVALVSTSPFESLNTLSNLLYSPNLDVSQRIMILDVMTDAAQELANAKVIKPKHQAKTLISATADTQPWFVPSSVGPTGAGPWKEISRTETPLNWSYSYERELPTRPGAISRGKTRRWSLRSANLPSNQMEWSQNRFPQYAAAFMLPAMRELDKKRHGVDLLGRDFIVLGKLIYMLGVCMKCAAMHPEASALAPALMDMISLREVCHHVEAYVRRSVLFAASCVLVALHPSFVASSLIEGSIEISKGLEWIRTWALHVAESDKDRECYTLAMTCLQLHSEMALQTSRALETTGTRLNATSGGLSSNLLKGAIKIPRGSLEY